MVNLVSNLFNRKDRIKLLEAEIADLKRIIANLIPSAEKSVDYYLAGEQLGKHVKHLQERLGTNKAYAGVA